MTSPIRVSKGSLRFFHDGAAEDFGAVDIPGGEIDPGSRALVFR